MLSPHPHVRGPIPKLIPLLVSALRKRGCEVVQEPWGKEADDESALAKLPRLVRDVRRIRRRLAADPVDVMVVHTSHEWMSLLRDIPLTLAAGPMAPCIVLQFHGGRSDALVSGGHRAFKAASWLLFHRTDAALFLSKEEARETRRFYRHGQFHTVSNPFSSTGASSPSTGVHPPTLLFAGRLIADKGIFDLVEAVSILRHRTSVRLLVAGEGPARAAVEDQVRTLDLQDHVKLAGYLDRKAIAEAYRAADAFVLPTYWGEGFPTAISEAMDAGLPVVTTNSRGMADHLEDGVNALFVPKQDPAALAEVLERLLGDERTRASMGDANRSKVVEFAPDLVADQYLRALAAIVVSTKTAEE
jgi:glycosyltransferase involved in cell wall biosynthesis